MDLKVPDLQKFSKLADEKKLEIEQKKIQDELMKKREEEKKQKNLDNEAIIKAQAIFATIEKHAEDAAKQGKKEFVLYHGCSKSHCNGNDCLSCRVKQKLIKLLETAKIKHLDINREKHEPGEGDSEYYIPPYDSYWSELIIYF